MDSDRILRLDPDHNRVEVGDPQEEDWEVVQVVEDYQEVSSH